MIRPSVAKYAGIGSRETPPGMCRVLTIVAKEMQERGFVCVSGGAAGADRAFQDGAGELFELWRPENATPESFELAENFHPRWDSLSPSGKALQARNGHILLGGDLETPVDFVLCWTENGLTRGGTGQGIRIARAYQIPIFNFGLPNLAVSDLENFLKKVLTS